MESKLTVDISDLIKKVNYNLKFARMRLANEVLDDSEEYIPMESEACPQNQMPLRHPGKLRRSGKTLNSGRQIEYDLPYAHYIWEGELYGPFVHGKPRGTNKNTDPIQGWYTPKGTTKQNLGTPLRMHMDGTSSEWTHVAAEHHMQDWVQAVADELLK